MKKAILYTRVSSKEQVVEGNSLESQRRRGYEYAEQNDLAIVKHFEERGESAKTTNRPVLKQLLEYVAQNKGEIDVLLIYKVDRLSRDTADYLALKQILERAGIVVASMTEHFDDTPLGSLMEKIASSFSQYDNDIRAERSKGGMEDGVRAGRWQWQAPIGYANGRVDGMKNVVHDPRKGYTKALQASWQLIDNGCSVTEAREHVNAQLQELGYKPVPIQTFSSMLTNKLYKGVVCGFGMEIQSRSITPIVEPILFDRVQLKLSGNKNAGTKYIKVNPLYPLKGILRDKNGHALRASSPRGNGGVYPQYHCPKCKGMGIRYDVTDTEDKFMKYAGNMKLNRDIKEALREALRLNLGDTHAKNEKTTARLNKRLVAIKAEKKDLSLKNIRGVIPDGTAQEMLLDYEREETGIKIQLNQMATGMEDAEEILEFGLSKLSNLAQTFQAIEDINIRDKFQKWLFPARLAYDGEKFGTTRIPLIYRLQKNALAGVSGQLATVVTPRRIELRLPG